jgi:hypothetical protein
VEECVEQGGFGVMGSSRVRGPPPTEGLVQVVVLGRVVARKVKRKERVELLLERGLLWVKS